MYYIYILRSLKNSRLYTGSTEDLNKRLNQHNTGISKYTRLTRPFELLYTETYNTRSEAVKRETYLKTGKGREEIKEILKNKLT